MQKNKKQIEQGYELTLNQYCITNNNNRIIIKQLMGEIEQYKLYISGLKNIPTNSDKNMTKS